MSAAGERARVRHGSPIYDEVVEFLFAEAELLDERHHREWLRMLSEDIRYVVPVRVTGAHTLDNSLSNMAHFDEDSYSLRKRVERFETEFAWAEDPPSRTRRYITNIRCWADAEGAEIVARSNLLLFRSRGDLRDHDLLSGVRNDELRREDGELRLLRREVLLDEAVLRTQNLAIFL
jgi:3-phenylpropionate/cinnamic acid dioxygenase small subunit